MLSHSSIWSAIDTVARIKKLSRSGLARASGLDPTTFNLSKRFDPSGKQHWPAMYTLSKVLSATGITMSEFGRICDECAAMDTKSQSDEE